jgi:hypothetical protein
MAIRKLKNQKKAKVKKPMSRMRAHRHTHAFILEPDGRVTCECDPFMTFAHTAGEAQKISDWFSKVSEFLRSKY